MKRNAIAATLTMLLGVGAAGCPETPEPSPPLQGDRWQTRASLPRGTRQEMAVVNWRDRIVTVGGFNGPGAIVTSWVSAYDPLVDSWEELPDLPVSMHHVQAAATNSTLFVLGWLEGGAFVASAQAYRLDADAMTWEPCAPLPEPRGAGIALAHAEKIWVFGGYRNGRAVSDAAVYDPDVDTWTTLPSMPVARDHLVGAVVDGRMVLIGGRQGGVETHDPGVYVFDPALLTYAARAVMPTSRAGAAAAALHDRIYVFGGEVNFDSDDGVFADVESYDLATDSWAIHDPMPVPRHGMGAAAVDEWIYIPGGGVRVSLAEVDHLDRFQPAASTR